MVEDKLLWVSQLYHSAQKLLLLTLCIVPYYLLPYLALTEYFLHCPTLCVSQVIALETMLGSSSGGKCSERIFAPFHT